MRGDRGLETEKTALLISEAVFLRKIVFFLYSFYFCKPTCIYGFTALKIIFG